MENGSHSSVPSARFSTQGVTVEVECCPDDQGTWRARVLEPADRRGGWSHGARAWQAINAAVRGIDTYVEQTAP